MTYQSSQSYESNISFVEYGPSSEYSSNPRRSGLKIVGLCQGTCYTSQGCTCR